MNPDRSLTAVHVAVFLFGLAGLFGKFIEQPALVIVLGRTVFAAMVLWPLMHLRKEQCFARNHKDQIILALTGALLALHWWTFFQSIQVSTVAVGLLTFSSFPMFVTIMEPIFFREQPRLLDFLLAAMVTTGLVLVVPNFDMGDQTTQGAAWGVLSGFTFALLSLLNRKYVQSYPPRLVAFQQNFFAALALIPFTLTLTATPTLMEFVYLAFLGVFCTALAHALFISSLKHIKASLAAVITSLEPVYGIILAMILLKEHPTGRVIAGGVIILVTTFIAARFKQEPPS